MKIGFSGLCGKMGTYIVQIIQRNTSDDIIIGFDYKKNETITTTSEIEDFFLAKFDILIDFSQADISYQIIKKALEKKIKVISGTTGHSEKQLNELFSLAQKNKTNFIWSANYTTGAAIMAEIAHKYTSYFTYKDLVETHHITKIDHPSGTAIAIATSGMIPKEEIQSVRLKESLGEHTLIFTNNGEKLTITHQITARDSYEKGFLRLYDLLKQKKNIFYRGLQEI